VVVVPLVAVGVFALIRWQKQRPVSLRGSVIVANVDPRKQLPIGGVLVWADDLSGSTSKTDSSGFFVLTLPKPIRRGHPIVLHYRHQQYRPLDVNDYVGNQLYIVHLEPTDNKPAPNDQPSAKLSNVRVRYTEKTQTEFNVGSAVKTFEVQNKGNIPCKKQHPCSPDGKWKASLGAITLDAGVGNEFRAPRASCIAGPCPFTRIESNQMSQAGRVLTLTVRDWSDTATGPTRRPVFQSMVANGSIGPIPVIFGEGMSFTLPSPQRCQHRGQLPR
jgi:hypothetical protein